MSFSPLDNQEDGSPIANPPRVTMCLDKEFEDDPPKSENMKVYARVRPMLQREEDEGYRECIAAIDEETIRAVVPANSVKFKNSGLNPQDVYDFKYTQAFGPDVGQFLFFENTIMDAMLGYIEGQNSLIFNYGITNSGKTYTLQGNEANPGIIPLAMHLFFGCIEKQLMDEICVKPEKFCDIVVLNDRERVQELRLKEELLRLVDNDSFNKTSASDTSVVSNASKSFSQILCECFRDDFKYQTETTLPPEEMIAAQSAAYMRELGKKSVDEQPGKCNIWVSFIEIYNEYIYDLLQPNITQRQKLSLAEDQNGDVYIKGAREICVSNSTEAIKLMYVGRKNLRIASTKLNYQSSRSHCIFTVKIARVFDDETHGTSGRVNRISFCDLAGSERANKSQTSGMRLKEAGYINTSLMVLGRCLDQLRRNQTAKDKKMIPFRESKLTRLFSNHFLGKGKAVMIANASPCEYTFDETLNVLRFSALAKDLTISDSYISTAQNSIMDICNQWHKSKNRVSDVSANESYDLDSSYTEEIEKRDEMIEKLVDVAESLRQNLEQEKKEKVELEFKIREEVGNEYAKYSDELLDEQKKIYERQIESLRDLYKQRFDAMKETYEKKIHELQEELNESDDSFENSISEMNKTFDKIEEESLISFSPAVGEPSKQVLKAEVNVSVDTSMDFFDAVGEDDSKANSDIQSLKEDLESISKELSITKQKLEEASKSLKQSQTEGAVAKEKSDALNCKLLEANQVLEEYRKELEQLKSNCESCENEIDSLLEEKKCLQDNVLTLSDQLAQSETKAEQFNKEKCEVEESSSQKLAEKEKKIADLEEECRDLKDKLKDFVETMEEVKTKYNNLEEEYDSYKNSTSSTAKDLIEKFNTISQQLAETASETEDLKKEKLKLEDIYSQKLAEREKKIADLEEKCRELHFKLEESVKAMEEVKTKYNELEEEYENYKNSTSSSANDFNDLKEKFDSVSDELELATAEIELLKQEKINAQTNFSTEKSKLLEEVTRLDGKCKEMDTKVENLNKLLTDEKSKYDELAAEYESYKNAEIRDKDVTNEKLATISNELDAANSVIESLRKEKLDIERSFAKEKEEMLNENSDVAEQCKNLKSSLETAIKDIEDKKLKIYELESEIESLETSYKTENLELQEKLDDLKRKLASVSDMLGEAKIGNEKSKELGTELETITLALDEEKSKVAELVSKCSAYESEKARLLKDLEEAEEKLQLQIEQTCNSNETGECENLDESSSRNSQVFEQNSKIAELELKIKELESSCATYKSDNSELMSDLKNLQEKLDCVCQELEESKSANERSREIGLELEKISENLEEEKSKANELLCKCDCLETENAKLLQDIKTYEENSSLEKADDQYSAKIEELALKLDEINQLLEEKQSKIDQLDKECSYLKSENADLLKTLDAEKEKYIKLSDEQALAINEVKHLQKEISEAVDVHSKALSELKMKEAAAQEKCEEMVLKLEETSKIIEDQKFKIGEAEENSLDIKNQNLELSERLSSLKEDYSSFSELYGKLLQVLEKCEFSATQKVKLLHSSSIKNLDELADLNRQVREKETSIEELERALCDCQKQLKESEAKAKKQMHAIKQQHSIEIEEMAHLKKLVEEENLQLKATVTELEKKEDSKKEEIKEDVKNDEAEEDINKEDEKKEETMKRSSSNLFKGKKKRSLSEVSKDEVDKSQDKENSDRESLKEKTVEEKVTKRRRVLRQRQDTAVINTASNSESEEEISKLNFKKEVNDDEYVPSTKATIRKKVTSKGRSRQPQKKSSEEMPKVPTTRTTRRKIQDDTENVSPVKKAMAFVGSKLRSVAQTVTNMPSPRITRGRRKLYNADAATPQWKL
ncbi:unnamed protein product [Larinioides sclopetarius]|uniref:Kinesin motor domain-containing protein n=1 Tax=Larinioides sclopetarius TaxID=280406 RepID=A0AAV1ZKP8_9ARAC